MKQSSGNRLTELSQEIERLNTLLEARTKENMALGQKLAENESKYGVITRDFETKIREIRSMHDTKAGEAEGLTRTVTNLNDKLGRLSGENEHLVSEVREGQEKLRLSTNNLAKIANELNDLKYKTQQATAENEQLRRKLQEAGDVHMKISELERRARDLEYRNQGLEREKGEYEGKTRTLEQKISSLTAEIERVQNMYGTVGKEYEGNKRKLLEYEQK